MTAVRIAPFRPLTATESIVVAKLAAGDSPDAIARALKLKRDTIYKHIFSAAAKLPGTLSPQSRVIAWYRGASHEVLAAK